MLDVNTLFGPLPVASGDLSVESLRALLTRYAIGSACTLSTLGLLLDPAVGNAATLAACAGSSDLLPAATLNPTLFFGDAAPVRQLKADGFVLTRFFPHWQGWPLDYAPFRDLLTALAPTAMPIMVDVTQPGEVTTLMRVLEGYPAPVILSGVDTPFLAEALVALRQRPNFSLEISGLLAPGGLQMVAQTVGAERLLFGTGAPAAPIASALHTLDHAGVDAAARDLILSGNARRLLGVK